MKPKNNIFSRLFNASSDEPIADQRREVLENPIFSNGIFKIGCDCDEISGSEGPFGRYPTNPIPVNGPNGETVYINRLRSRTGVGFFYHRLGTVKSSVSQNNIDQYELVALDASEWNILYFSPYFPRRSVKTPEGMSLVPWRSMDKMSKIMVKIDNVGSHFYVENFPNSLPDVIEESDQLNSITPGIGKAMAKKIQNMLNNQNGNWRRPNHIPLHLAEVTGIFETNQAKKAIIKAFLQ